MDVILVTFRELKLYASKSGKCGCGKQRTRQRKFWATLNPYNRNAAGEPKTSTEIYADLAEQVKAWKLEPITCVACHSRAASPLSGDRTGETASPTLS